MRGEPFQAPLPRESGAVVGQGVLGRTDGSPDTLRLLQRAWADGNCANLPGSVSSCASERVQPTEPRSMGRRSKRQRCDLLLMLYIFAHLTTVMDSSSEFHQLAFAHGATVEGQFLASLAPATRDGSTCSCRDTAETSAKARASGGGEDTMWLGGVDDSQRFFRVMVKPSH